MAHSANSQMDDSAVPTLQKLVIRHFADLIVDGKLPPFNHQFNVEHSNEIFEELRVTGDLNTLTMTLMCRSNRFLINTMNLADNEIKEEHLRLCFHQNLISFRLENVDSFGGRELEDSSEINLPEVLRAALNPTSCQELRSLDVSGKQPLNSTWPTNVAQMCPSLISLKFDNRPTTNQTFALVAASFSQLRYLSISAIGIDDISPISNLQNLEVLIMYDLNFKTINAHMLARLRNLRVLDVSGNFDELFNNATIEGTYITSIFGIMFLSESAIRNGTELPWPHLQEMDMSGLDMGRWLASDNFAQEFVCQFIRAHPNLKRLGLSDVSLDTDVVNVDGRQIQVLHSGTRKSQIITFSHYIDSKRIRVVTKILEAIVERLKEEYDLYTAEELDSVARLCCILTDDYFYNIRIQRCVSECFLYLCQMYRVERLSVKRRLQIVEQSLGAVEYFEAGPSDTPEEDDADEIYLIGCLHHNVWLNLRSEHLLSTNGLDLFRIANTALNAMLQTLKVKDKQSIVSIVSSLIPKLSPAELEKLTLVDKDIEHFVTTVEDYLDTYCLEDGIVADDIMAIHEEELSNLKKTLFVMSNLTGNTMTTYDAFLEADGVEIAIRLLKKVEDNDVVLNMLSLLSKLCQKDGQRLEQLCKSINIAVLLSLTSCNFQETDKDKLFLALQRNYSVCYLLTNLLTYASDCWEHDAVKQVVSESLLLVFTQLPITLDKPLITLRSLVVLENIVRTSQSNGAVMMCLWSLRHSIMNDTAKRTWFTENSFSSMFLSSNLCPMISEIAQGRSSHLANLDPRVVQSAKKMVEFTNKLAEEINLPR